MIYRKEANEILALRQGGKILAGILNHLLSLIKPGISTAYLEKIGESMIIKAGGRPAFKNYPLPGNLYFPSALCTSINHEVVHGSALPDRIVQSGDIIDLDIGMEWPVDEKLRKELNLPSNQYSDKGGFYTDTCQTIGVGKISQEAQHLLKTSQQALMTAIALIKPGLYLHEIGEIIEMTAKQAGYNVVKDFVGHGLGYFAHEAPDIYNYKINPQSKANIQLAEGMVIAIEPMINAGQAEVEISDNDYTAVTKDGSLSAHFEHSIAVTEKAHQILTI